MGHSIVISNIDGLITRRNPYKRSIIEGIANQWKAVIVCLTETHLTSSYSEAEINMEGYVLYRADRVAGRKKGGVAIYIKDHFSIGVQQLHAASDGFVESLVLYLGELRAVVVAMYRPPRCPQNSFENAVTQMKEKIDQITGPMPNVIIMGDFNLPDVEWTSRTVCGGLREEREQAHVLFKFMDEYCLNQEVDVPTRGENILDLLITNNDELVNDVRILYTKQSDHEVVIVGTNIEVVKSDSSDHRVEPASDFEALNFWSRDVNWTEIKEQVSNIQWHRKAAGTSDDPEEIYDSIMKEMLRVVIQHVPKKNRQKGRSHIPRDRRTFMRKRAKIMKKLDNSTNEHNKQTMKAKIVKIEACLEASHRAERMQNEERAVESISINRKYFYKYARKHASIKAGVGPLISDEGNVISDTYQITEKLRHQYENVYSTPIVLRESGEVHDDDGHLISTISFSSADIINSIKTIKANSAAGPDNFPAILLKNCAQELGTPLALLWQCSIRTGCIPNRLKSALVTPIYKGGGRSKAANYRPVALTSHLIKIFEKIIVDRLTEYFDVHNLWNDKQHGFRKKRSCLSQLLNHFESILQAREENCQVDVVYLDFEKAFDKVDYGVLSEKLLRLGITGELRQWINGFLRDRTQRVILNGILSAPSLVKSGVPQGSVLGPVLFLCMMVDTDQDAEEVLISSFADDTRLSCRVNTEEDKAKIQSNLGKVYLWALNNNMKFSDAKFELMHYGETLAYDYFDCVGKKIDVKKEVKDLGILMSDSGDFHSHYSKIIKEARNKMSWILRVFETRKLKPMLTLYRSLVVPRLEYCSQLWTP